MSGMKNETQQLTGSYVYDPQLSKVNFACPSENILANFNPFDDKLPLVFPPGFLEQIINTGTQLLIVIIDATWNDNAC